MNARYKAFTMVELLVTIAVILLVSAMLIPFLGGLGADQAESAANQFQGYLSATRARAIASRRDTALFVVPPSDYINSTRLIMFQLKEKAGDGKQAKDWQILPGSYGMEMPENVIITNANQEDLFYIWFNSRGALSDECDNKNMSIRIGPRTTEMKMPTIQYGVGRNGSLLRFNSKPNYVDE